MNTEVDVTSDPSPIDAPTAPQRQPRRFGLVAVLVPWVLVVVLGAVAAVALLQWQSARAEDIARSQARLAAIEVARLLTEWDASDGLEDTRADLQAIASGDFADQIDELFGADAVRQLVDAKVTSEGEIGDVFVQSLEGDVAEVFVVVTQTTSTQAVDMPTAVVQRAAITLEREDGQWIAVSVELTSDETLTTPS
jgi:type II secretory pathway pseudopilin PulG